MGLPKLLTNKKQKNLEKAEAGCIKYYKTAAATVLPQHTLFTPVPPHTLLCHTRGRDERQQVSSAR